MSTEHTLSPNDYLVEWPCGCMAIKMCKVHAVAPEMLKALKRICNPNITLMERINIARSVIAKVEAKP